MAGIAAAVGVSQRSVSAVLARARSHDQGGHGRPGGTGERTVVTGDTGAGTVQAGADGAARDASGNTAGPGTVVDSDVAAAEIDSWAADPGDTELTVATVATVDAVDAVVTGEVVGDGGDGGGDVVDGGVVDVGDGGGGLPVLPPPADRSVERELARWGLLSFARPRFVPAGRVPLAGLLLAVPALTGTGLLEVARAVYGGVPAGFYGLDTVLVEAVFRALLGEPRAEGATRVNPTDLGRVLGLDRAPEVKTVRRKQGQLAARGLAADLQEAMARRHLAEHEQAAAVLYVDGHVRTYHGTRKIQKTHVSRLRFPAPATVETWICHAQGDPVWVVMAEPGASLAGEIRGLVGDERRVLVGFDRGGWCPALFADLIGAGFDVLTWRKAPTPEVGADLFGEHLLTDEHGIEHRWLLAEGTVTLAVDPTSPTWAR